MLELSWVQLCCLPLLCLNLALTESCNPTLISTYIHILPALNATIKKYLVDVYMKSLEML